MCFFMLDYIETFGVDGQLQDESSANGDSAMQEGNVAKIKEG